MSRLGLLGHRIVLPFVMAIAWVSGTVSYFDRARTHRLGTPAPGSSERAPLAVAITLGFAPENFHIRLLQSYGVVNGARNNRAGESCLSWRCAPDRPLLLDTADHHAI